VKKIQEESKYLIVDLALSKEKAVDIVKGAKMKAIVKRFNKFSSYPLLVEASRELTGSVFFSDLDMNKSYLVGDIITVYYDSVEQDRHYFKVNK